MNPNVYTFAEIIPENTTFILLSFEGPDRYSLAGGLGVRVTELGGALAHMGYETHLIFVGAPNAPEHEISPDGLHLWRCCQPISRRYPKGVYQGEEEKRKAFEAVVPSLVLTQIAQPAQQTGKLLVILGEDWHTTTAIADTSDLLYWQGLRNNAIMLWNANNTFGFERIDWARMQIATRITAVSRYMKQKLWTHGVNALVLPNGIPERFLEIVPSEQVTDFQTRLSSRLLLTKFARFDPNKNWLPAIQAIARLRAMGQRPLLFMRGGIEGYSNIVLNEIDNLALRRYDLTLQNPSLEECIQAIDDIQDEADIIMLRFFVPEAMQRLLYRASHAVLANSKHEPFGLVGLEVMATQGIAFVGSTGEDYAQHMTDAISLDTNDPNEIVANLLYLQHHPQIAHNLRRVGHLNARFYTWPRVIEKIISKLQYLIIANGSTWPIKREQKADPDTGKEDGLQNIGNL